MHRLMEKSGDSLRPWSGISDQMHLALRTSFSVSYSEEKEMRTIEYTTHGTCSRIIRFDLDDENRIHNLSFQGGCNGNLQGIGKLCEGMKAEDIKDRIKGIRCGAKPTSCPDQLSAAIEKALAE